MIIAIACSSPSSGGDASIPDSSGTDSSADTGGSADSSAPPCVVQTCKGAVTLQPGETVSVGDKCCASKCHFQTGGGVGLCGCEWSSDCCGCPDSGVTDQ